VVFGLRAGISVIAPGYDPATRRVGTPVPYDPSGKNVIILEGGFAIHGTIRPMIDLAVFVEGATEIQHARFSAFYRWKGLDNAAIETLWLERLADEWPAIDSQRRHADLILATASKL
jgi:uridine kinase